MKVVILSSIVGAVLCASTPTVKACYCPVLEMHRALARAHVVFVGEVTEIVNPTTQDEKAPPPGRFYTIKFKVERSWKGHPARDFSILSAQGKYGCLAYPPVTKGEKYLVFADPFYSANGFSQDWLIITICNRTKPLANASKDLEQLERITNASKNRRRPRD